MRRIATLGPIVVAGALALGPLYALSGCTEKGPGGADGAAPSGEAGRVQEAGTSRKTYTIATVVKIEGIPWFQRMREGVKRFAGETGHEAFLVGPPKTDAALQVRIVEDMIAQGVDAICVVPFSVEALEPALEKARRDGIKVIAHEASNLRSADLIIEAFDNFAYGAHLMDHLARLMGEEGDFAVFVGSLTSKSHNEWVDGALARQKETYPRMRLVADRIEEYDDQNLAYEKTKELLKAYPNLRGIQGSASTTAAGAGLAIEERGLQGKVSLVGTGLVSMSGQYLKTGSVKVLSLWDPADAGYVMNLLALRVLEGKAPREGEDLGVDGYRALRQDPNKASLFYGAAWVDVTKENMDRYGF
jgi:simple sugar transport system substrate-binding protein